jgi:hypothetical protein
MDKVVMKEQIVNQWRKKLHPYTLDSLHDAYQKITQERSDNTRNKLLAEVYYLTSTEQLKSGNFGEAFALAQEAFQLYESSSIKTLDQAAPILFRHLPDRMHQTVVKERVLDKIPPSFRK